jgi:hypothetical protein
MCKLLFLTGHKPSQRNSIIRHAWRYFERTGERDGFGAAWISRSGKLAHIRSSNPLLTNRLTDWSEGWHVSVGYNEPSDGSALIIHGRKATCGKSLDNTHPMLDVEQALVHNGIVESDLYKNSSTTCDSELLLRAMQDKGTAGLASIEGYFAFALLDAGARRLTIVKDDQASLVSARIPGYGYAFGTTREAVACATPLDSSPVKDFTALEWSTRKPHRPLSISNFTKKEKVYVAPQSTNWRSSKDYYGSIERANSSPSHHNAASYQDLFGS